MTKPALNEPEKQFLLEVRSSLSGMMPRVEVTVSENARFPRNQSDRGMLLRSDSPAELEREALLDSEEQLFSPG